jgi:signal transduction histidine kinase
MIIKITTLIKKLISPKHPDEEISRKEFILNILIFFSILCFFILNCIRLIDFITHENDRGLPIIFTLSILGFFIFLAWLSNKGFIKTAAGLIIAIYSLPMLYSFLSWGADLPAALLMGVLIITFFGVLMGAKIAVISAAFLNIFLIALTSLQSRNIITVNTYWRAEKHELGDAISYAILMMIITVTVWIFDNQTNKALSRARQSEKALAQERDELEIKVEERTSQLREMEAEKISQLYHLAEFGRLSSGVFHDLINPLTAVSLNLEQIKNENQNSLASAKDCLQQAIIASHKMEDLITCIKKSIKQESSKIIFSPKVEIDSVIKILNYKTRKSNIEIFVHTKDDISLYGDPVKFSQIIMNLISNSIDAYGTKENTDAKIININLINNNEQIILEVSDQGEGITTENINKIFQPFFSTKDGRGLGLGLSSTKNLVEKEFSGSINVQSIIGEKTIFTILIPLQYAK